MGKFLVRRLVLAVVIIFFGSMITYAVLRCLPTSYIEKVAQDRATVARVSGGNAKSKDEILKQLEVEYGFDKSVIEGFFVWFGGAIQGDFGDSWLYEGRVIDKFNDVIWYSVIINIITFALQFALCIPLGILAARKQYSKTDYAVTVFALLGMSLPTFFLATLLKFVFAVKLGWVDTHGVVGRNHEILDTWGKILDIGAHMILPIITLMFVSIGGLMRYTRTNMLEVLNADYIRTARAKGLPEKKVINKHAFRNTLIPLISYMSYLIPSMFGGAMITETLYQIPGIGYISYQATMAGDIPFTMFYTFFTLILTQISLLIADIMYAVVDPRVRVN